MHNIPTKPARPTVAIFDLDSTITRKDTYLAFLLNTLRMHPLRLMRCIKLPVAVLLFKTGRRNNSWLKATFLQAIVGGMSEQQLNQCVDKFLNRLLQRGIRPNAIQAIKEHKEANHGLILATASFDFYSEQLGRKLGFEHIICTRSAWNKQKKLLGKINGENCYGSNKLARLKEHFGNQRDQLYLIGYTDHHSDQPFLHWVDRAIAVNPTNKLRQLAQQHDFEVIDWEHMANSGKHN